VTYNVVKIDVRHKYPIDAGWATSQANVDKQGLTWNYTSANPQTKTGEYWIMPVLVYNQVTTSTTPPNIPTTQAYTVYTEIELEDDFPPMSYWYVNLF